jgi:hypothetical protein
MNRLKKSFRTQSRSPLSLREARGQSNKFLNSAKNDK